MNLLREISQSAWMMHPPSIQSYLPLVARLVRGENVDFNQPKVESNYALNVSTTLANGTTVKGTVAVMRIRGAITKSSQLCGPEGTEDKNARLKEMLADDKIDAIVFDIDTPGGQVAYLETFSNTIKNANKPIVAWYNDLCASAGYYIASSCAEIYASEKSDMVGSIGTMATLADYTEYFKKEGIKVHHLFAKQSTEKNKDYMDLTSGDPEKEAAAKDAIINNVLTPMAQEFIDLVKSRREITDENAFKGKVYLTQEAIDNGLIDGIMSFDQAVARALELAQHNSNTNSNTMKNKFTSVAALLGYESIEIKDGHVSLSAEDMTKIDSALENPAADEPGAEDEPENNHSAELEALNSRMDSLEKSNKETQASLTAISAKLDEAIKGPAAESTKTDVEEEEFTEGKNELDNLEAPEMGTFHG